MANTKSAKKRIERNERRRIRNRYHLTRSRSYDKKARATLTSGDVTEAEEAIRLAVKELDHAASKGVIHANKASRRKSRLMKQLEELKAESR
nr:30S ribosomal protein S20 [Anaerolineae bacterium]